MYLRIVIPDSTIIREIGETDPPVPLFKSDIFLHV